MPQNPSLRNSFRSNLNGAEGGAVVQRFINWLFCLKRIEKYLMSGADDYE